MSPEELQDVPRRRRGDDLPGPAVVAAPVLHRRQPDHRGVPGAPPGLQAAGPGAGGRHARPGRHPQPAPPAGRLPAPVLRRHAPARDDRDGAGQRPEAAHRRRADHRARRDRAGADPRPDRGPAAGLRLGRPVHHPRPGRRRRDRRRRPGHVRRAVRRVRPGRRRSSARRCTRTPGVCWRASRRSPASRPGCIPIPGTPPSLLALPTGCSFHPRCEFAAGCRGDRAATSCPTLVAAHGRHRPRVALPPAATRAGSSRPTILPRLP